MRSTLVSLALLAACGSKPAGPTDVARCPTVPDPAPAGAALEIYHRVGEPENGVTVKMVAADCAIEAPLLRPYPGSVTRCFDVGTDGIARAFAALRRHGASRMRMTESRPENVSPHGGGWTVTATWPGGGCFVGQFWIWNIADADRARFDALIAELGHIDGVQGLEHRW